MTPMAGLALLVLGFLFFWLYRDYRVDLYRQRLFALRDELWDFAAAGDIEFDHPAHRVIRARLNGLIRFAHVLSLTWLVAAMAFRAMRPLPEIDKITHQELERALASTPPPTEAKLRRIHDGSLLLAMEHIVFISPVFWLMGLPVIALALITYLSVQGAQYILRWVPGKDLVDSEAARLGALA